MPLLRGCAFIRRRSAGAIVVMGLWAGCLGGCAAKPAGDTAAEPESPYARNPAKPETGELRALTEQMDERTADRRPFAVRPQPRSEPRVLEAPSGEPAAAPAVAGAAAPEPAPAAARAAPAPAPESAPQRRERLARELAGALSDPAEKTSALDEPLRGLLLARPSVAAGDQPAALKALEEQAAALRTEGFTITRALLARRVTGFGQFTPFASGTFLVGRAQPVLVYVEVDKFGHRELSGEVPETGAITTGEPGELRWAVELSQELQLYHDADGVLVWRSPEQSTRDLSARQRRDHYLVQRVELPARLTVGGYRLKVIVRDRVSESTAEAVIPIEIVADAGLVAP